MMRTIIAVLFLILLFGSVSAQGPQISEKEFRKARIILYHVSEFQTPTLEHSTGVEYILDYQVIQKKELSNEEVIELKPILLDSANYITGMAKSCPFIGEYAIRIVYRSNVTDILISKNTCIKMIIQSKVDSKMNYFDLTKNNAIQPWVEEKIQGSK